ncbi:cupredoxin domain-containing protein [Latilactobacillus graminis]|uniref:EfeO-type cupredoxin-like domain-containing protein n=2 Tax=Latilactobacillus graminis TaxID=60519 RepID=A0AA89I2T5_9LACO|nr:cupredoxin domain-containing protein [Latilactobacillus graminis]KRM23402.1 hypothetical protein FC90_GL000357 [Latilactobacillus graminis DSM 20719]QFP80249.1 cupredoxin domain-containing protein [Latilactobacillus graminis]
MTQAIQKAAIQVAGGYNPEMITLKQGVPAELTFTRTSDQGCLDVVHSTSLGFEKDLTLGVPQMVNIPTDQVGEFDFSCGMDMFHGKVVIEK